MRIAVSGASGYIGAGVVSELRRRGFEVRVQGRDLSRLSPYRSRGLEVVVGDIRSSSVRAALVRNCDVIVHCAAALGRQQGNLSLQINSDATFALAKDALRAGVERFIYVSSIEALGNLHGRVVQDDSYRVPNRNQYSFSKWQGERSLLTLDDELNIYTVRPGMVYGPRSPFWTRRHVDLAKAGKLSVIGAGRGSVLPVFESDLFSFLSWTVSANMRIGRDVFNMVNDEFLTWRDWADAHSQLVRGAPPRSESRLRLEMRSLWRRAMGRTDSRRRIEVETRSVQVPSARAREEGWQPRPFRIGMNECHELAEADFSDERWGRGDVEGMLLAAGV